MIHARCNHIKLHGCNTYCLNILNYLLQLNRMVSYYNRIYAIIYTGYTNENSATEISSDDGSDDAEGAIIKELNPN